MMDIVERLRGYIRYECPMFYQGHVVWKAAEEIERLREALRKIADEEKDCFPIQTARDALKGEDNE